MFKIVHRDSVHGSDPEQPHSSTKFERLSGATQQSSVSVKNPEHEIEKRSANEQIKKVAKSSPQTQAFGIIVTVTASESPKMEASIQLIDDELELLDSIKPLNCAPLLEDTSHSYRSKAGPMESLELERIRQQDCHPLLVEERMRLLNGIFAGTIFNVNGGLTLANLGFDVYQQIKSNENYIIMEEIKPRTRSEVYSPDTFSQKTNSLEYGTVLNRLHTKLHSLPKCELATTEGKWFSYLVECWAKIKLELPTITEDGCTIKWKYLKEQSDRAGLTSSRDFSTEEKEIENDKSQMIVERYMVKRVPETRGHQQREWRNRNEHYFERTRSSKQ
uniref:YqaJ domain-containing protein n=1 Tax=Meloidogyne hapla TaxID=6305 RepID=A0A1I8BYK1_MELHA